jgi:hypothetical protein
MAATLDSVTEQIKAGNTASRDRDNSSMKISTMTLEVLQSMLDLSLDDSASARERAREAARSAKDPIKNATPDSKAEEVKAKGFFSKMGKAVMSPIGAMGKSMKTAGKGIGGFLKGLSSGLASFANPAVLIGVTVMSVSLPIFAAGLAAAFKVFELIAGEGKALEFVTGIIESLGEAIGTILHKVLVGFGEMVKRMGPFIKDFFDGLAVLVKALTPIITTLFKVIKDIITDPVLNKTIQTVLNAIVEAIRSIERVVIAFAPVVTTLIEEVGAVIIAVSGNIEGIVATIGSVIEKILGSFDNVVNQIKPIIEQIGATIKTIIDSIGDNIGKIGKTIEGVITAIGDSVSKVVGSISDLITAIGATISGVIDSVVGGIERLSTLEAGNMLKVAAGLSAIGVGLIAFTAGAAIAGGTMPSKEQLESVATSIERFGKIPSEMLAPVGQGMKDIGLGLMAFGAGSFVASLLNDPKGLDAVADTLSKFGAIDATNFASVGTGIQAIGSGLLKFGGGSFISGLSEAFGKWIGASDPIERFQKFAAIGPGLKQAGDGVTALAKSFDAFNTDNLERIGDGLDNFMGKVDMKKLTAFSAATEGLMTGQMLAQLQIQANQESGKTGGNTTIVTNQNMQTNQSSAVMLPPDPVSPGDSDVMNVRIVS